MVQSNSTTARLQECLQLIETQWQRGSSAEWTSYDFEKLSEAVSASTGITLSVSTLKRVFGKVSYGNMPSTHTLNTLARFAGFEDWNGFCRVSGQVRPADGQASVTAGTAPTPVSSAATARRPLARWWPLLLLPIALLGYSLLSSKKNAHIIPADPSAYVFTCNKIRSEGVPNSVIFHYRAPAGAGDSVFIAQTWDVSRKKAVLTGERDYSAIYYYPGYFNAKLMVDTQIIRTHDLFITSNGWLALAEAGPVPTYFTKTEVQRKEGIGVDSTILNRYHLIGQQAAPAIRLYYVRDFQGLSSRDFQFETTFRNGSHQGSAACQYAQVLILEKNGVFVIPLAARGCVGDLQLWVDNHRVSSQDADLSGFGCDLTQWTNLKVSCSHGMATFFVNGHSAYSLRVPDAPSDIVGVQYRFSGTCAVQQAQFVAADGRVIGMR